MADVIIKHRQHLLLLLALECLDQKPVIMGKEEEASGSTRTFTRLEHHLAVPVY